MLYREVKKRGTDPGPTKRVIKHLQRRSGHAGGFARELTLVGVVTFSRKFRGTMQVNRNISL